MRASPGDEVIVHFTERCSEKVAGALPLHPVPVSMSVEGQIVRQRWIALSCGHPHGPV